MRTFFSLPIDKRLILELLQWRELALPPLQIPVPAVNLHITLCFNGETTSKQVDTLCQLTDDIPVQSFAMKLDQFGYFNKPRIAWLGPSQPPAPLMQLHEAVTRISCAQGLAQKPKQFIPHISLFRKLAVPPPAPVMEPQFGFFPDRFGLYESLPGDRPQYRCIQEWSLKAKELVD